MARPRKTPEGAGDASARNAAWRARQAASGGKRITVALTASEVDALAHVRASRRLESDAAVIKALLAEAGRDGP